VFENDRAAHEVADRLKREGFSESDIHIGSSQGEREAEHHRGFIEWLEDLFSSGPKEDATTFHSAIEGGRSVVAVDTDESKLDYTAELMERCGAIDVNESERHSGQTNLDRTNLDRTNINRTESTLTKEQGERRSIPVIEQQIDVQKRTVIQGGVRVYSHVTEQPVEERVNLRQEKVRVQRRPVDRPVTAADESALRDQTIEVTETREEPVVRKTSRVVEEVVVDKDTTQRTETVRDKVRRTDVRVEPLQAGGSGNDSESQIRRSTASGSGTLTPIPDQCTNDFRNNFQTQYAASGGRYEDYEDAYSYGYRTAGIPEYKGKRFEDVEQTLRTDFMRNNPNSTWDRMKGAVRYGWERMTGKR
jgi:uncharacterized protein (TIGR02271 family)